MRQDDPALDGDILVYRRIPPIADYVQWENDVPIPSRQNFSDKDDELSVHIASETTPEAILEGHDGYGLVQLTIKNFRDVYRDGEKPVAVCRDDEDPKNGHILICGRPSRSMKLKLQRLSQWVVGKFPRREPDAT